MRWMKKIVLLCIVIVLLVGAFFIVRSGKRANDDFVCKDCNVILITLTNLRYNHLSQNGYFRATSPALDAFAKESVVFDNAFAHSSWTLPEGISIFTSLYPYRHQVMNRYDGSFLSQDTPTLIDVLSEKGYLTAGFTGGFDYDQAFGLTNRFGEYQECIEGKDEGVWRYGKMSCTAQKALEWIKNYRDNKFFIHVQGYDPHCPFNRGIGSRYDKDYTGTVDFSKCLWTFSKTEPHIIEGKPYYRVSSPTTEGKASVLLGEEDVNHLVALYDESITQSDAVIGSFLDEIAKLGLGDNTIIIFTSEHGDIIGKHGRFMRGGPLRGTFYDDVLHVPLLIKHPKLEPARIDGLVEHIDIMPTLLDFLGIKKPSAIDGRSVVSLITENKEINEYVFAGSEYHPENNLYFDESSRVETIRNKDWKLIKETILSQESPFPVFELYDLNKDPEELYNVAEIRTDILDELLLKLNDWSEKMRAER